MVSVEEILFIQTEESASTIISSALIGLWVFVCSSRERNSKVGFGSSKSESKGEERRATGTEFHYVYFSGLK